MPRIPGATFVTEKMVLRQPRLRDSWKVYRHLSDPLMRRFLRTPAVPRPWHGLAFILKSRLGQWRGRRLDFILELRETGEVVGCRSYFNVVLREPSSAEFGVWVARRFWGHDLAWEGAEQAMFHIYETVGIHRMYFRVHERNAQARPKDERKSEDKTPWEPEGTLRDYIRRGDGYQTMLLYSRLKTDPPMITWLAEQRPKMKDAYR